MWKAQGPDVMALLGVTPTKIAKENSLVTAKAEEEYRWETWELGKDLQNIPDKTLGTWKDGSYMREIKKAYAKGLLTPPSPKLKLDEDQRKKRKTGSYSPRFNPPSSDDDSGNEEMEYKNEDNSENESDELEGSMDDTEEDKDSNKKEEENDSHNDEDNDDEQSYESEADETSENEESEGMSTHS